jgi:SAM-dependent methyltransferase
LLDGKSLYRALFNLTLQQHHVSGRIVDLGSKSLASSYFQYLNVAPGSDLIFTDIVAGEGIVRLNVEEAFPFENDSLDCALSFNLFEHVFNHNIAPGELFRVLRPGGRLYLVVPFLHEYHADPEDYYRLTDTALRRVWEEAGFQCIHMEAIGEGLLTACATRLPYLAMPDIFRSWASALLYLGTTFLDRLIASRPRVNGKNVPERFALGHFAIFEKP